MSVGPVLQEILTRYGLGDLADWASEAAIKGWSDAEIALSLRDQPAYRTRFPAIFEREKEGLPPISAEQYLQYEQVSRAAAKGYGVELTQDEINQAIAADVSVKEMDDRLGLVSVQVYQTGPQIRDWLVRNTGMTLNDMIRFAMDPKVELPKIQKRWAAAQLGAEADLTRFGDINLTQAERLVEGGLSAEQARAGFGELARQAELFQATDQTEQTLDTDAKLSALLGDTDVTTTLQRRADRRTAAFKGGGSFATGKEGVAGLGTANTQ